MGHDAKKLKVAAVQMTSENGNVGVNLARATGFVDRAAGLGAKMIILPEFMPTGYVFTKSIWDAGEPKNGKTVQWLRENSKRLGVYLGTSFLEADGDDFFNTFIITDPDGKDAGRVRKQTPAAFEAFFTKGDAGPHVIQTSLGKIGIGICYENQLAYTPQLMHSQSVDLMLMPHSAPTPSSGIFFPKIAVKIYNERLYGLSEHYAKMLGIPVVLINKSGPFETPLPGLPIMYQKSKFPGFSSIVDSDGTVKARLGDEEALIVEEVSLDPSRKTNVAPQCPGHWAVNVPWALNTFRLVEAIGSAWYKRSPERKKRAKAISSGN